MALLSTLTTVAALCLAAPPSGFAATEQVNEGGFESGGGAWTFSHGAEYCTSACGEPAATGTSYAATDYPNAIPPTGGAVVMGEFSQMASVPAAPATLSFKTRMLGAEHLSEELTVEYASTLLKAMTTASSTFETVSVPLPGGLTGAVGEPLTFKLTCFADGVSIGGCNRWDFDDISLLSGEPDKPAGPTSDTRQSSPPSDTVAPETRIVKAKSPLMVASKKAKARTSVTFSSEAGARFECKLDGHAFAACVSPLALKLKTGRHTFSVRAIDAAGNVDPSPATATIRVKVRAAKKTAR
jgi:hypothetical protein